MRNIATCHHVPDTGKRVTFAPTIRLGDERLGHHPKESQEDPELTDPHMIVGGDDSGLNGCSIDL
jgi:hypothetical protein